MDGKSSTITKLNGDNWSSWRFELGCLLGEKGLRGYLYYPPQDQAQWDASHRALSIIGLSVQPEYYHLVEHQPDACQAWQAIESLFINQSMSQQMSLRNELHEIKLLPNESVQSMTARVVELRNRLLAAGGQVREEEVVQRVMAGLGRPFQDKIMVLEAQPGFWQQVRLGNFMLLMAEEQRRLQRNAEEDEQAAKMMRYGMVARGSSSAQSVAAQLRCANCGLRGHEEQQCKLPSPLPFKGQTGVCWSCGKRNHSARECKKGKQPGTAFVLAALEGSLTESSESAANSVKEF